MKYLLVTKTGWKIDSKVSLLGSVDSQDRAIKKALLKLKTYYPIFSWSYTGDGWIDGEAKEGNRARACLSAILED